MTCTSHVKALARSGASWAVPLLLMLCPWLPSASIILPPWEEVALEADFIGIVECEVAGIGLAKCKVVESWKGPNTGARFSLATSTKSHDYRHPIPLCGQQFLVMASRVAQGRDDFGWTPALHHDPLSWRDLPAQYAVRYHCLPLPVPQPERGKPYRPLWTFGVEHRDLASFRRDVLGLLHAPAARQQTRAMQARFNDCIRWPYYDWKVRRERVPAAVAALCHKVRQARSPDEIVSLLLYHRPAASSEWLGVIESTLASGGPVALRRVPAIPPEEFPGGPAAQRSVMYRLGWQSPGLKGRAGPPISAAQEARSLRTLAARALANPSEPEELPRSTREELDLVRKDLRGLETPEQIVERLVAAARGSEETTRVVYFILIGGAYRTLRWAETAPPDSFLAPPYHGAIVAEEIRQRLGLSHPRDQRNQPSERLPRREHPTQGELARFRELLAQSRPLQEVQEAFEVLTIHDPATASQFLLSQAESPDTRARGLLTYRFACWFGWKCGKDRERHLRGLLQARNPVVRAAAAVYLCFENEEAGLAALREARQLPGAPGAWAAATLARRGDKTAASQALDGCLGTTSARFPHELEYSLLDQMLVLLSNSAKASQVPQPAEPYLAWWERYRDKIALQDVWMPLLEKQKID